MHNYGDATGSESGQSGRASDGTRGDMLNAKHVRKTVSFLLMGKAVVGGAFALLTLWGVAVPYLGIPYTPGGETVAAGLGGVLGFLVALKG